MKFLLETGTICNRSTDRVKSVGIKCYMNEIDLKLFLNSKNLSCIAIYGAQMVAVSMYYAIKTLYPDCKIVSFIVSGKEGNPTSIDGIPVVTLREWEKKDVPIYIAVPENLHKEIVNSLEEKGLQDYVCIDSETEAEWMRKFYEKTGQVQILSSFPQGKETVDLFVGMSKFYKDRELKGSYHIPEWVQPIQAGAALTDVCVAFLQDNAGDNISLKNVNYCELTAMYWMSKHISSEYMGLFHYRRMLDVKEEDLYRIKEGKVDVILPYPTVHYPNIGEHHKRYIKESDWDAMVQALKEISPEYYEHFEEVFSGQYFYNYNMLIAKEEVFKEYCNWLFPILERTEELSVPKGDERADRYIGYMGENLTTLYFTVNKDKLTIAHTGRKMLV